MWITALDSIIVQIEFSRDISSSSKKVHLNRIAQAKLAKPTTLFWRRIYKSHLITHYVSHLVAHHVSHLIAHHVSHLTAHHVSHFIALELRFYTHIHWRIVKSCSND